MSIYNLTDDIAESHDLATQNPDMVKELRSRREAWERGIRAASPFWRPCSTAGDAG